MKFSHLLLTTILIFSLTILPQTVRSEEENSESGYYRPKLRSLWRRFKDTRVIKKISSYWGHSSGKQGEKQPENNTPTPEEIEYPTNNISTPEDIEYSTNNVPTPEEIEYSINKEDSAYPD